MENNIKIASDDGEGKRVPLSTEKIYKIDRDCHRVDIKNNFNTSTFNFIPSVKNVHDNVFVKPDTSDIEGEIYLFNSFNELVNKEHRSAPNLGSVIKNSGKSVGRIITVYSNGDIKMHFCGTSFNLSEDIIITCYHNIVPQFVKKSKAFSLDKVFINYDSYATIGEEIILEELEIKKDDYYELEVLERSDLKTIYNISMWVESSNIKWDYDQDIALLKFKKNKPKNITYRIPYIPSNFKNIQYYTIGYPAGITIKEIEKSSYYNNKYFNINSFCSNLNYQMSGFQKRILTTSKINGTFTNSEIGLGTHKCPTLNGCSGGLVGDVNCTNKHPSFSGIHLGGTRDGTNILLCVSNPLFIYLYINYVLDKKMLRKHRVELEPFLKYSKTLNITKKTNSKSPSSYLVFFLLIIISIFFYQYK